MNHQVKTFQFPYPRHPATRAKLMSFLRKWEKNGKNIKEKNQLVEAEAREVIDEEEDIILKDLLMEK